MPSSLTCFAKDTVGDKETVNKRLYSRVFCISLQNKRAEKSWSSDTSVHICPGKPSMASQPCLVSGALQCQPVSESEAASLVRQEAEPELFAFTSYARDQGAEHVPYFLKRPWIPSRELNAFLLYPVRWPLVCRKDNAGTPVCCISIRIQVYLFSLPYKKRQTRLLMQHFFKWHLCHIPYKHSTSSTFICLPTLFPDVAVGNWHLETAVNVHSTCMCVYQSKVSTATFLEWGKAWEKCWSALRGYAWIPSGRRIFLFFTKEMQDFLLHMRLHLSFHVPSKG